MAAHEKLGIRIGPQGDLPPGITIDGVSLEEIVRATHAPDSADSVLRYEDILSVFRMSADQYTPVHHERLLGEILLGEKVNFFLEESLPFTVRDREFFRPPNDDKALQCILEQAGIPLEEPEWILAMGNRAADTAAQAYRQGINNLFSYVTGSPDRLSLDQLTDPSLALRVFSQYVDDVDRERAALMAETLQTGGCGNIARDYTCMSEGKSIAQEEFETYIQREECRYFLKDLQCIYDAVGTEILKLGTTLVQTGVSAYRKANGKGNTQTDLGRAVFLRDALVAVTEKNPDIFPTPPQRILVVGPGLEKINPSAGVAVPRQSYEPFGLADFLLTRAGSHPEQLRIDLADINPHVIRYLEKLQQAGEENRPQDYFFVDYPPENLPLRLPLAGRPTGRTAILQDPNENRARTVTISRVKIDPLLLRTFHPMEADIITNRVAPDETYDMAVMLNTFGYFGDEEKRLALENINRMLKPGGVFLTDIGPGGKFPMPHRPECEQTKGEQQLEAHIRPIPNTYFILYTKKE